MKKAFGLALLFAMLAAPAIAGGGAGGGDHASAGGGSHVTFGPSQITRGQPAPSFDRSRSDTDAPRANPEHRAKFPAWGVGDPYEKQTRDNCDTPNTLQIPIAAPLDCPLVDRRGLPF